MRGRCFRLTARPTFFAVSNPVPNRDFIRGNFGGVVTGIAEIDILCSCSSMVSLSDSVRGFGLVFLRGDLLDFFVDFLTG